MKFRDYKTFCPGQIYHIFNRGNQKNNVFLEESDYLNFLKRLKIVLGQSLSYGLRIKPLPIESFSILCYCLMPNHFHFLIQQNSDVGIDRLITKVCTSYAMYFNKKYKKVGNLFQDAFKAKLVDSDSYLAYLSAYIHNNPTNIETYQYSSFPDYCGVRLGQICKQGLLLGIFNNDRLAYKKFVSGYNPNYERKIQNLIFEE
jgi:REP element-mobilizing transposase RayT